MIRLGLNGGAQVNRELDKVDGGVNKTMQSFSALGGVIAGVFGALTISNIAKTADTMQSLESRIGLLPQTVGDVGAAFDEVAKKATENRMGIQAYAEVYTRIGNAAQDYLKTSADLEKVTSTLSQALVVGGATAQEQASAFLQFSQALGSGTLQGDEFRAMAEAAPQYLDQLAKALGHPRGELKKLASEGKLTTKEVIQATMQMSDYFNKMYKQIPMTIGQALVLVNNRWSMFINRLNRSSGAVTWVADKFLWLADKVEYSLDVVTEALGGAENAIRLLGVVLGSAGVIAGVWALNAAFTALSSPIMLAVGAVGLLYLAYDDFISWSEGRPSIMEDIFGDYNDYKGGIEKFINALKWVKDAVGGWETIFESFAAYLAGKWLTRVLATLGIATKAAASTGSAIAAAGNSGGVAGGKGGGIMNKALTASFLYPLVDGVADNLIGDTSFAKWAKSTTLNDLFGSKATDAAGSMDFSSLSAPRTYLGNPIGGVGSIPSIDYKPSISLVVHSPTNDPQDIADSVRVALGDQARDFLSELGNTLKFNTGG